MVHRFFSNGATDGALRLGMRRTILEEEQIRKFQSGRKVISLEKSKFNLILFIIFAVQNLTSQKYISLAK